MRIPDPFPPIEEVATAIGPDLDNLFSFDPTTPGWHVGRRPVVVEEPMPRVHPTSSGADRARVALLDEAARRDRFPA